MTFFNGLKLHCFAPNRAIMLLIDSSAKMKIYKAIYSWGYVMYTVEINVYCLIFFSVQPLEPRQNAILSVFTNASQACNCSVADMFCMVLCNPRRYLRCNPQLINFTHVISSAHQETNRMSLFSQPWMNSSLFCDKKKVWSVNSSNNDETKSFISI